MSRREEGAFRVISVFAIVVALLAALIMVL